jgi:hypothetical protein
MKLIKNVLNFLVLIVPFLAFAQAEKAFNGIVLDQNLETVSNKLEEISETMELVTVDTPIFPMAKTKENHLVCKNLQTQYGKVARAVFTFADDTLQYIEARGNVEKTLVVQMKDTSRTYLNLEVYPRDKLFYDRDQDAVWIMNEEAMHLNLFTWNNPLLDPKSKVGIKDKTSSEVPAFLEMGSLMEDIKPVLKANSLFTTTDKLDGSDPNAQIQINCFGVQYMGFPRKIEARFGDEKLNVVWILTGKGEEDRIRRALKAQFGEPDYVNDAWEIFNNWQVGLRKDKPEILLMEKSLGQKYKTEYFKQ